MNVHTRLEDMTDFGNTTKIGKLSKYIKDLSRNSVIFRIRVPSNDVSIKAL